MAKTVRSATLAGTKEIKIREFQYHEVPKDAMVVKIEMCGI
ncbi:MAG: hypothetical protein ACE5PO_01140 [Candidatus Bathyarchaeia archaeon]